MLHTISAGLHGSAVNRACQWENVKARVRYISCVQYAEEAYDNERSCHSF
jgi:hypothetical protein